MKFTAPISNRILPRVLQSKSPRYQKAQTWKLKSSPRPRVASKPPTTLPGKTESGTGELLRARTEASRTSALHAKIDGLMSEDLLALFRETGALLDGHFILRSGLHSRQYFQCALLLQHTDIAAKVCGWLADKLREFDCDAVISPALGGIIVGQEVGRALGKRHIFVEKDEGKLVLRRGFQISPDEKFIVVEDVVTRGGRVQETIDIVRSRGGTVSAVGVIVDRSGETKPNFGCPFVNLIKMDVETFAADKLPPDLAKIPAVKPGSK